MSRERDPLVRSAITALGFSSPEPPAWEDIAIAAPARPPTPGSVIRWRTAIVTAVVVLLVIGIPVWLLFRGEAEHTITDIVPTTSPLPPTSLATVPISTTTEVTATAPTTTMTASPPETTTSLAGVLDVRLDTDIVFGWGEENVWDSGTFTASGPAVEAGLVCPEGTIDLWTFDSGLATWRTEVRHTCADGSGTFHLNFDLQPAYVDGTYIETGSWTVAYGTDAYAELTGSGTDSTISPEADHYVSVLLGEVALAEGTGS